MKLFSFKGKEGLLLLVIVFLLIGIIGGSFNLYAITSNNCRMPVYADFDLNTDRHFSFSNSSDVNAFMFTDIIRFFDGYFSIGDFMIFIGFISAIVLLIDFSFFVSNRHVLHRG